MSTQDQSAQDRRILTSSLPAFARKARLEGLKAYEIHESAVEGRVVIDSLPPADSEQRATIRRIIRSL